MFFACNYDPIRKAVIGSDVITVANHKNLISRCPILVPGRSLQEVLYN